MRYLPTFVLAIAALAIFIFTQEARSDGPSFDCTKAETADEKTICSNPVLAEADLLTTEAFQSARAINRDAALEAARTFIAKRRICATDVNCIAAQQSAVVDAYAALGASVNHPPLLAPAPAPEIPTEQPAADAPIPAPAPAPEPVEDVIGTTTDSQQDYDDPFEYCATKGTIDEPDSHYVGPEVSPKIVELIPRTTPNFAGRTGIRWRCMTGTVWVCLEGNTPLVCMKAPWLDDSRASLLEDSDVRAECASNPNAESVSGTHGMVRCRGTEPVMNADQYPVDARGFAQGNWVNILLADENRVTRVLLDSRYLINCMQRFIEIQFLIRPADEELFIEERFEPTIFAMLNRLKVASHRYCEEERAAGRFPPPGNPPDTPIPDLYMFDADRPQSDSSIDFSASLSPDAPRWEVTRNHIRDEHLDKLEQERQARNEQARQLEEAAAANAAAEQRARVRAEFMEHTSATQIVGAEQFAVNPFIYSGQTIAVYLAFVRMVTETEALFTSGRSLIFLDDVPASGFPHPNQIFVVALTANGTRPFENGTVPYGTLAGVYPCQKRNCEDFFN